MRCRGRWYAPSTRRMRWRQPASLAAMLLLLLAVALTACGQAPANPNSSDDGGHSRKPDYHAHYIVFAPTVSYAQTLREVTGLGEQPGFYCPLNGWNSSDASTSYGPLWQPMGQRDTYARTHGIFVWYGPITLVLLNGPTSGLASAPGVLRTEEADSWLALPGNPQPSPGENVYACPAFVGNTYTAATPIPIGLPHPEARTILRVTFSAPLGTYDQALAAVSDLGLGLVDPCVLQAVLSGKTSTPRLAGQETTFAATQTLTLATNAYLTSSLWQQHLQAMPGVAHIEAPYTSHC